MYDSKVINFDSYKSRIVDEERELKNIVDFLQIKLIEEIFYKADVEINKLYERIDTLPGMKRIMNMGGRKNLDFYFHRLFLDKILNQVIIVNESSQNQNEIVNDMRIEMVNNLIMKYIPEAKMKKCINDERIINMFFTTITENCLYGCDKGDLEEYFQYRNEKIKLFQNEDREFDEIYCRIKKTRAECDEIKSNTLGIIKFDEEKNIYFCDYLGRFNNFTLKILNNDKKEVENMIPLMEKIIENVNFINDWIGRQMDDAMDDSISDEQKMFLENMSEFTEDVSNLISINIWNSNKAYLIYSCVNEIEGKKAIRIGTCSIDNGYFAVN